MQNRCRKIILVCFSFSCLLFTSLADGKREHFLSFGPGIAVAGMGGAFTALGDDMSVIYYNPALLGRLSGNEISANYWSLLSDSRYMFLGFSMKLSDNTAFAISGTQLGTGDIEIRQNLADSGTKKSASQNVINAAYSGYIENIKLNYGIGIKYLYYDIVDYTGSGGALDIGASYRLKEWKKTSLDAGFVMQNLINIPMKLLNDEESAPFITKAGIGFNRLIFPKYNKEKDLLTYDLLKIAFDLGIEDSEFIYAVGAEYTLFEILLFRAGYDGEDVNFGIGFKFFDFQFDYAYQVSDIEAINKVGFIYRWGQKNKITYSRTKTVTDDFQEIYQKAQRLYESSVRDGRAMIDANKTEATIVLLNKTIPLKPEDEEARKLLAVAEQKQIANETNKYIEQAQKLIKQNKKTEAFKEAIKALEVSPTTNVKQLLSDLYSDKSKDIVIAKNEEIEKLGKRIDKATETADFKMAEREAKKLEALDPMGAKKYMKRIEDYKELFAGKYIKSAQEMTKENKPQEAFKHYTEALKLLPEDVAIADQKALSKKEYEKKKQFTFEENMYAEKLYYIAAIALANDEKPKDAFIELDAFNPVFKWNGILEEFLIKNNILKRRMP